MANRKLTGTRRRGALGALLAGAIVLGGVVPMALAADPTRSGALTSLPVAATVSALPADGSVSGQLASAIDPPVLLGDNGVYTLSGTVAPDGDATGNAQAGATLAAGDVPGVITDSEDGTVKSEPGSGIAIDGGQDQVTRTPSGLVGSSLVQGVQVDMTGLNDKVATLFGVTEVVHADEVRTQAAASVLGTTSVDTRVAGLRVLGQQVALTDGRLAEPVSRSTTVHTTDIPALLRSLGVDEADIDEYDGLISSGSVDGTLTVTVSTPASGGLHIVGHIQTRVQVKMILSMGSGDLTADNDVLVADVARFSAAAPTAIRPSASPVSGQDVEVGQSLTISGAGFVVDGTQVLVGGSTTTVTNVATDGSSVTVTIPVGLSTGSYSVEVVTAGGSVSAGKIEVRGEDYVDLTLTAATPQDLVDGGTVALTGSGFRSGGTRVEFTDSSGTTRTVSGTRVQVADSGLTLQVPAPEGLTPGTVQVAVRDGDRYAGPLTVTVHALTLPEVPASGSAAVTGLVGSTAQVPLTVDNSSVMTWSNPDLINPAGTASSWTDLSVAAPSSDATGNGLTTAAAGGFTGTVTRTPFALTGEAVAGNYGLALPAPWNQFFSTVPQVVTAGSITTRATAPVQGTATSEVSISDLKVLGQSVALQDGKVAQAQTFTLTYSSSQLSSLTAMNGVFFSDPHSAYKYIKSDSYATLRITVAPGQASASGSSAQASAFTLSATVQYKYYGENSGLGKTRARHGTGGSRDGQEVTFFTAQVGAVQVTAPNAVTPALLSVSPAQAQPGDTVTVAGRAFSADAVALVDGVEAPTTVTSATTLTVVAPQTLTAGEHTVTVRTSAGTSNARTLTVTAAPAVTTQPEADVTVAAGDLVTLDATASGFPEPAIQWQRSSGDGLWTDISGANDADLAFTATREDGGAVFRAVFTNDVGSAVSEESQLTVLYAPVVTAQPAAVTATAGSVVDLHVGVAGWPAPQVQWQLNNGTGWQDVDGATEATWSPTVTATQDGAQVRAVLTNDIGTTTTESATLTVHYGPVITQQPADATVERDSQATFSVRTVGNPVPTVRWQSTTSAVDDDAVWTDLDATANPSALTTDLSLTATSTLTGTRYRAVLDNGVGPQVVTDAARLTVTAPQGPAADGVSALGSPLSIDVDPLIGTGEATGGAISGLINGEIGSGVELIHGAAFSLPETGTPEGTEPLTVTYPAGVPAGTGIESLGAGVTYGDVSVTTARDSTGITTEATVTEFVMNHLALDDDGMIGQLTGLDELVHATQVSGLSTSPVDDTLAPTASGSIGSLTLLGTPVDLVDGTLPAPVTVSHESTVDDLPALLASLGVENLDGYLNIEDLSGVAHTRIDATASQLVTLTDDGSTVIGLRVTISVTVDLEINVTGSSQSLVEHIELATSDLQKVVTVDLAGAATARNDAELPDPSSGTPTDPTDPTDPGTTEPTVAYPPSATPDRVILSISAEGDLVSTYRTDPSVTQSVAQIRSDGQDVATLTAVTRDPVSYESSSGTFTARSHVATLTGLTPGGTYDYRVGSDAGWSPWYTVTVPSSDAQSFTMLNFGDAQNDLISKWTPAVQQAYADVADAAITLNAGDQINHADNDDEWGSWFGAVPEQLAEVPQIMVAGNHEYADGGLATAFREHYTNADNGPQITAAAGTCEWVYQKKFVESMRDIVSTTDYQGVRFVTLAGTTQMADLMPSADELASVSCAADFNFVEYWWDFQAEYLDDVLKANPGQWSVVSIHQPLFSTAVGRAEAHLREAFLQVIEDNNVDLVLQGHDHTYGRGYLASHEVAGLSGVQDGPVFATSVLGPKSYDLDTADENDWTLNGAVRVTAYEAVRTYQKIRFDDGLLTYEAVSYPSGEVVDSFVTCHSADGSQQYSADSADLLPAGCELAAQPVAQATVEGTPQTGQTLSSDLGTWLDGLTSPEAAYQWLRDDEPISGATLPDYQLTAQDEGHSIAVQVTVTATGYGPVSATSAAVTAAPAEALGLTLSAPEEVTDPAAGVVLTAQLTRPTTGTVTFYADQTPLGTVVIADGATTVTLTTDALGVGTHRLHAELTAEDGTVLATSTEVEVTYGTPGTTGDEQTVNVDIPSGALTITSPYTPDDPLRLGPAELDQVTSTFSAQGVLDRIVVTDTRAGNSGFAVAAVSSDFGSGSDSFSAEHVGLVDLAAQQVIGNALQATDVTVTDRAPLTDPLVTSKQVASYPSGLGTGSVRLDGTLSLQKIPSSVTPGTYTATLVLTAF